MLDQKNVQESEIRILNAKLEGLNKENKQTINDHLDQKIAQQELDSKLEVLTKENEQLINLNKLSDQKVVQQKSEIELLHFKLETLSKEHKQLLDIHGKFENECASQLEQESKIKKIPVLKESFTGMLQCNRNTYMHIYNYAQHF